MAALTWALFTSGTSTPLQALYDQFEQELEDAFAVLTPPSDYPAHGWQLTPDTSVGPTPHFPDSTSYSPAPFQYSPHLMADVDAVPLSDVPEPAHVAAIAAMTNYAGAIPAFPHLKDLHTESPTKWIQRVLDMLPLYGPGMEQSHGH